jgi:hypothetical protein
MPKDATFATQNFEKGGGEWDIGGVANIVAGGKIVVETGGVFLSSVGDALTALAGGAQAGTALAALYNRFTVVATVGDSAQLPVSAAGDCRTVVNASANSMNVFPQSGDKTNALATNTAFAVAAGKSCEFFCTAPGQWHTLLSA